MAKLQKAAFLQKPTKKLEIPYHQSRERDEKKELKKSNKKMNPKTPKSCFTMDENLVKKS